MKKKIAIFLFVFICLLSFNESYSQTGIFVKNGSTMNIQDSTSVYINGNLIVEGNFQYGDTYIKNFGKISLTDSLINLNPANYTNFALFYKTMIGSVHYAGTDTFNIIGKPVFLTNLFPENATTLNIYDELDPKNEIRLLDTFGISRDIKLLGDIKLDRQVFDTGGEINNSGTLELRGNIKGETNNNRIYNELEEEGFIYAESILLKGGSGIPDVTTLGLGLEFEPLFGDIAVNVMREHHSKHRAADGSISKSFHIINTGTKNSEGKLIFNYFKNDYTIDDNESNFKLWYNYSSIGEDDEYNFDKYEKSDVSTTDKYTGSDITSNGYVFLDNYSIPDDNGYTYPTQNLQTYAQQVTISDEICDNPPKVVFNDLYTDGKIYICKNTTKNIIADNANGDTWNGTFEFLWTSAPGITINSNTLEMAIEVSPPDYGFEDKYTVMVTDTNGCFTIKDVFVKMAQNPVAEIIRDVEQCINETFTFDATKTDFEYITTEDYTVKWDFGDSSFSEDKIFSKKYTNAGIFDIKLTAISTEHQCIDSVSTKLTVHPLPKANFTKADICFEEEVNFKNISSIFPTSGNGIKTYILYFGDGSNLVVGNTSGIDPGVITVPLADETSNIPLDEFTHKYDANGTYNLTFNVISNSNCIDTYTETVRVLPEPVANFAFAGKSCPSDTVYFTNSSTIDLPSTIEHYSWDFGNGKTSYLENPYTVYTEAGEYTVKLTVTSNQGCDSTIEKSITVYPYPIPDFSVNDVCENITTNFLNNSTVSSGTMTYQWNFGNGTSSTTESPSVLYSEHDDYNVKLICTTDHNCIASLSKEISIFEIPQADFSATTVCLGNSTHFTNKSGISNGELSYEWTLPSGTVSVSEPAFKYTSSGDFLVDLKVISDKSCENSIQKTVTVHPVPQLDLGGLIATCASSIDVDAGNPGSSYLWSDNSSNQTITIEEDNSYNVKITNEFSCVHTENFIVELNSFVQPNLGSDTTVCGFYRLDAHNPDSEYLWNTGENTRYVDITKSGTYSVTVTDQNDCIGTDEIRFIVNPIPEFSLDEDIVECSNTPVVLSVDTDSGDKLVWSTGESSESISILEDGDYSVMLTNIYSCSNSDTVNVSFKELPENTFSKDTTVCDTLILDAGNPGATYVWSNKSTSRTIVVRESGSYSVSVSKNDCEVENKIEVVVHPAPFFNLDSEYAICEGDTVFVDIQNENYEYLWSDNSTNSGNYFTSSGIYSINVVNSFGCEKEKSFTVSTKSSPAFDLGRDITLCNDEIHVFTPEIEAQSFEWYNIDGLLSTGREYKTDRGGNYWLVATNSYGCKRSDTVLVMKNEFFIEADFLVASDITEGDTIQFVDLSTSIPETYIWSFGDGITDTISNPTHIYYSPGYYSVSMKITSGDCTSELLKNVEVKERASKTGGEYVEISEEKLPKILDFNIYPNPNNGNFTFDVSLSNKYDTYIQIFNITGRSIYLNKISNQENILEEFSFSGINPGVYFIKIVVENETQTAKFVKY